MGSPTPRVAAGCGRELLGHFVLFGTTLAFSCLWISSQCSAWTATPLAVQGSPGLDGDRSNRESLGFLREPDEHWSRRRQIHVAQMALQASHEKECSKCNGHAFWQMHYEPSFSCTFERRIGPVGEGGKWVCDPHRISEREEACLVYSVGSNSEYGFEEGVHNTISSRCEIHTFDANPWHYYNESARPPPFVQYHVEQVGTKPLREIFLELGHRGRTIDLFKIDCEGCELETYQDWFSSGVNIRQILVEVHGPHNHPQAVHRFFRYLNHMGYVIFHKEPNTLANNYAEGGSFIEYALLRLSPEFSRASQ